MKILAHKKIDSTNHSRVTFIRVEPIDLHATLKNIITALSDLSWISKFDKEYIRTSFNARALPTLDDITKKLNISAPDEVTSDAGEYVVSTLSKNAIVSQLHYLDVPLAELYSKQKSGNPGFDFHTQNDCETLIFGESKYLNNKNAYTTGFKQVIKFIDEKKDIKDILDLRDFVSPIALTKIEQGTKGFAIGFSAKKTDTDILIAGIIKNKDYKKLLNYEEILLVAVNL